MKTSLFERDACIIGCKPDLDEMKHLLKAFCSYCIIFSDADDTSILYYSPYLSKNFACMRPALVLN